MEGNGRKQNKKERGKKKSLKIENDIKGGKWIFKLKNTNEGK